MGAGRGLVTVRRVEDWKPGDPLPPPGTVVGDISLHAPGVKFGVVVAPDSPIPPVAETIEAAWPRSIAKQKAAETEQYQLKRWGEYPVRGHRKLLREGEQSIILRQVYERRGYIGLAILDIEEDTDERQHRAEYVDADVESRLEALRSRLLAQL